MYWLFCSDIDPLLVVAEAEDGGEGVVAAGVAEPTVAVTDGVDGLLVAYIKKVYSQLIPFVLPKSNLMR